VAATILARSLEAPTDGPPNDPELPDERRHPCIDKPGTFRLPMRLPSTRPTPASRRLQTSRCRCARRPIPAPSRRSNHRVRLAVGALMDGARRSLQHHRPRNRPNALAAVSEHCPRRAHSGR
jgi:hypothetical protein